MVLQQLSKPVVWGHATPGSKIYVKTDWDFASYVAETDSTGVWRVNVSTPEASYRNYTISLVGDGSSIVIKDVLIGEVWIAAGQSNMEMPMRGWTNIPVENALDYLSAAPMHDKVRMFTVGITPSYTPLNDVAESAGWQKADASTIPDMSATAFFYALKLNSALDVPVGIVTIARGATRVEAWIPKEQIRKYSNEKWEENDVNIKSPWAPYTSYNGIMWPVHGYTAKGFIWYQGCSNVHADSTYAQRLEDMVAIWRRDWGDTECKMPFYTVEIAPCIELGFYSGDAQLLRRAQLSAARNIPNCDIVCTNDLVYDYEINNIHPCQKKAVGDRLAFFALHNNYGFSRLACKSPEAVKAYVEKIEKGKSAAKAENPGNADNADSVLCIEFRNCEKGVNRYVGITALELCYINGDIVPVSQIDFKHGGKMIIKCNKPEEVKCVRYGWGDFVPGNLKSVEGLPFFPFELPIE